MQIELHSSPWGDLLKAVADGRDFQLSVREGYGIVVLLAAPPFPFNHEARLWESGPHGLRVQLPGDITGEERSRVHFEEVEVRTGADGREEYVICSDSGYVLHVTGRGPTVEEARRQAYGLLEKIVVPRMYNRDDIGERFLERDRDLLKKWGYL